MTNLTRRRSSFDDMRRELDRVFENFLPTTKTSNGDSESSRSAVWSPRVDVAETDEAYQVRMDLPGIDKDNLEINYHEGRLAVSGERSMKKNEEGTSFSRIERSYGRFYRSFSLPQAADPENIEATHENGVLSIRIPKTPESKPRRIDVS